MALFALLVAVAPLPPQEAQFRPEARGGDPRTRRPWVFSGELGWNGLAGIGLVVANHLDANLTLEAGLGVSPEGAKMGLRGRYGFSSGAWAPFLGAGFLYGTGNDAAQVDNSGPRPFTYRIGPSPYLQAVAGLEYQSEAGFNFLCAAGYARLLRHNLTIVSGSPSDDDLAGLRFATGSGPVLSLSWGYAF
jgi:hypothetical protein